MALIEFLMRQGEAKAEQQKRESQEAGTLRKLMSLYDEPNKDQYTVMGLPELRGAAEAIALKSARRKEQMAAEEMRLRAEELGLRRNESSARLAALTQEQGADNALAAVLKSAHSPAINTPGPFGGPVAPGGVTPDRLLQALAQNPQAINARGMSNVDNLLRALNTGGEQTFFQPNDTNFALPNVPGMLRVPTGPNTAVILADPTKAGQTVAITGPNGEQMGFGLPTRSGVTPLNTGKVKDKDKYTRLSKQLNTLIEAQGNVAVLGDAYAAKYQPRIDALVNELKGLEGDVATAGGASVSEPADPEPSSAPTITTRDEYDKLKKGTIYIGKDGKRYRKP